MSVSCQSSRVPICQPDYAIGLCNLAIGAHPPIWVEANEIALPVEKMREHRAFLYGAAVSVFWAESSSEIFDSKVDWLITDK